LVKSENGGVGEIIDDFHRSVSYGDEFPMSLMRVDSPVGLSKPLFSSNIPFDSVVNTNSHMDICSFDEASTDSSAVLFPSFLSGLPSNTPHTPKTPLSCIQPKLELKTPLGRPPPCVGGIDDQPDFGYIQQPSIKKETSRLLTKNKSRGNPVIRANTMGVRKKFTDTQQLILESFYTANLFTTKEIKEAVAQSAGLSYKQVRIWIMNRKVRDKKGLPPLIPTVPPSTARGFSETQRRQLTAFFEVGLLNEPKYREAIAKATGLTEKQIKVWRMNTRAKLKKEGRLSEA